jgi:hypothetical protein
MEIEDNVFNELINMEEIIFSGNQADIFKDLPKTINNSANL